MTNRRTPNEIAASIVGATYGCPTAPTDFDDGADSARV